MRLLFTFFISLWICGGISNAQTGHLQDYLKYKMQQEDNQLIPIVIKHKKQVDVKGLKTHLLSQRQSLEERRRIIVNELYSKNSQINDLDRLLMRLQKKYPNQLTSIRKYWAVNAVSCKASKRIIKQLLNDASVDFIQYDSETQTAKVKQESPLLPARSEGGAEKGLVVCKAPFMWNLGYTGRNRIAMNIDTGVNSEHPSLSDRFLGDYLPLSQAWFGYEHDFPFDIDQTHFHGTHTLGTMIGLDKVHSDTIGFAFNSYWISSDPIVTRVQDIRPESDYFWAFQWALNPDGDLNTSDDIPDVINNSWGVAHEVWPDCNLIEVDFLTALEAADCAVIFSAGNEGPNPQTTGMPAGIIKDTLNIFSVGALDGADASYPIADFSSRGPSHCDVTSPLGIKPEVSAPGVQVRSASGGDGYILLSGTSMAGPHVSGAVLLLREAFPEATSTELKNALYQTATDLGENGEDNIYGRGLINLEAAYNFLSEKYTPAPPIGNGYNLQVNLITEIKKYTDEASQTYSFSVKNTGENPINEFTYKIEANGTLLQEVTSNEVLNSGDSLVFSFDSELQKGYNNFNISTQTNNLNEFDVFDNFRSFRTYKLGHNDLPYVENFDTTDVGFANANMFILNPDSRNTWSLDSIEGFNGKTQALKMTFYQYDTNGEKGQKDYIILGQFDIPQDEQTVLRFNHSYARFFSSNKDSLKIKVSNNINPDGGEWIFAKGGSDLATHSSLFEDYTPADSNDWVHNKVDLSNYAGQSVYIILETVNDGGNNLYVDDLKVENGDFSGIPENNLLSKQLKIYPNPASDYVYIKGLKDNEVLEIIQSNGVPVYKGTLPKGKLDISNWTSGLYIIHTSLQNKAKLIIQH